MSTATSTSSTNTPPEGSAAAASPSWAVLPIVLVGVFLSGLDFFIVAVAIPSIRADLNASAADIQLIVASYALVYGVGMITGGRLGDLYGRRRMFMIAMTLFTLASAACGLAPNVGSLLAFRVVQGAAAALLAPQVLAIVTTTYTGPARAKAINWYAAISGFAAVSGQVIGGVLIKFDLFGLDWRTCFLINLPIGVVAILFATRYVPESRAAGKPRLDGIGVLLVTAALLAVVLPLIEGRQQGWPLWTWISLALAVPLFAVFAVQQHRREVSGRFPLVPLGLFRERAFTAGLLIQLVFWAGMGSYFLVIAVFLQDGRGLTPLHAGFVFAALAVGYITTSMTARFVAARLGRQVIALGALVRIAGLVILLVTTGAIGLTGRTEWLMPGLFIDGLGMGLAVAPLVATVLARVSPQHAGAGSGVLTTGLQVGNALGVALIGLIFYNTIAHGDGRSAYPGAFTGCLYFLLAVSVIFGLLAQFLPKAPAGAK
jgi:EmrB/QacA subfamily drug resistance transporter